MLTHLRQGEVVSCRMRRHPYRVWTARFEMESGDTYDFFTFCRSKGEAVRWADEVRLALGRIFPVEFS